MQLRSRLASPSSGSLDRCMSPVVTGGAEDRFVDQLRMCGTYLRSALLAWLFAYVVVQLTIEHLPYEFAQPYLAELLDEALDAVDRTPLLSGLLFAGVALVGAVAAASSVSLGERFGMRGALLAVAAVEVAISAAMAAVFHPVVAVVLLGRGVLSAVADVIVPAAIAPRVRAEHRATYLSIHSLVGRLGFAGVLLLLSAVASDASFRSVLVVAAVVGFVAVSGLAATAHRAKD